jgi:hypothetical protein
MPKKRNDPEAVRCARVRQLFTLRYAIKPNENDVLAFYGWLGAHHPELLPKLTRGDAYQQFKADLHGLYWQQQGRPSERK